MKLDVQLAETRWTLKGIISNLSFALLFHEGKMIQYNKVDVLDSDEVVVG